MQYRILGRTGLRVSEVGYGGGRARAGQEAQALEVLAAALDVGFNLLDTAPSYGNGVSETVIGEAVKGRRNAVIIATKTRARDPQGIVAEVEGSLRRLQTDVIDLLQFHGGWFPPDDAEAILHRGGLETYQQLRAQGKVRFLAFSADGPSAGVSQLLATGAFDAVQVHYNLMYQSTWDGFSGQGLMAEAEALGAGIFTMRSTTSGAFPKLMRLSYPDQFADVDWEAFLLNYTLSNPLVDSALMSLQTLEDVERCNAVSDNVAGRMDLREVHRR